MNEKRDKFIAFLVVMVGICIVNFIYKSLIENKYSEKDEGINEETIKLIVELYNDSDKPYFLYADDNKHLDGLFYYNEEFFVLPNEKYIRPIITECSNNIVEFSLSAGVKDDDARLYRPYRQNVSIEIINNEKEKNILAVWDGNTFAIK